MIRALTIPGSLELAELQDPQAAAGIVYALGLSGIPQAPIRKIEVDEETGEILMAESASEYVARVWDGKEDGKPLVSRELKGLAVRAGLQFATNFREALSDGIQLVVYRARRHGWWVTTDQVGGGDEAAFREWVKDAVTAEDASTTEATQLATTILNLEYLAAINHPRLPRKKGKVDLETIFADRALYNRWRRVASKLRRLVEAAQEHRGNDVRQSIDELVETVMDDTKSFDDLDQAGRIRPSLPPVLIETGEYDKLGRQPCSFWATKAQMTVLRFKLNGVAQWVLPGEEYGVTRHVLAEYRSDPNGIWRREYNEVKGWQQFVEVEEILPGVPEGATLEDPDWEVTYQRQWEAT